MEKEEKILKPEESLKIINNMIFSAKTNLSENSFNFLFWGWLISLISLSSFVIGYFKLYKNPDIVWLLVLPGMIVTSIYNYRKGKSKKVFSHIEKIHAFTWLGFIISYFIVILFGREINYQISQMIFLIAGMATFISGVILQFRPLILGGVIFWVGTILGFIISDQFVPLLGSIVVILGFLVPGYMLKSYDKKNA